MRYGIDRRSSVGSSYGENFITGQFWTFATWGNSGIAPYEGTRNQLSGNALRPSSCGLAKMESGNGALYWTGRVVEADIDLCGEPGGISRARGRSRFRA